MIPLCWNTEFKPKAAGDNPESNDYLEVEYRRSSNTSNTINLDLEVVSESQVNHGSFSLRQVRLPADALHANFQVEFDASDSDYSSTESLDDWFIDNVFVLGNRAPVISLTNGYSVPDSATPQTIAWSVSDPDGDPLSITRRLNGSVISGSSRTIDPGAGLGNYTFQVTASDGTHGGYLPTATRSRSMTLNVYDDDTSAPSIALAGSAGTEHISADQSFAWSVSDASDSTSSVTITKDGVQVFSDTYATNVSAQSFDFNSLGVGEYVITVNATDKDSDRSGDSLSSTESRTVIVTNAAPTAVIDTSSQPAQRFVGDALDFSALLSSDPDGDALTYAWDFGDDAGTSTDAVTNYSFATPGTYTVLLTVVDEFGASDTTTEDIVVTEIPPVANDDAWTTSEDDVLMPSQTLLDNDSDPQGYEIEVVAINGESLSVSSDSEIATATPDPNLPVFTTSINADNYYGFRFEVTEATTIERIGGVFQFFSGSGPFAAVVALDDENDFPDSENLSTADVLATTVIPLAYQDDGEKSAEINVDVQPGWYAAMFGTGDFGSTGITNLFLNSAPVAGTTFIHSQPMVPRFLTPTPASKIPNARFFVTKAGGGLVPTDFALPSGADVNVGPDGTLTYNPVSAFDSLTDGQQATDQFSYTVRSTSGLETSATATVTINGINDAPTPSAQSGAVSENSIMARTSATGLLGGASDAEGDTLTVSAINGVPLVGGAPINLPSGAEITVNTDGSFAYNPTAAFDALTTGETASDSLTFTISDGNGGTAQETLSITINGFNDAPQIFALTDPIEIEEGETAALSGTVSDSESGVLNLSASHGAVSLLPDGETFTWEFTATDDMPTETVTITVTDAGGRSTDLLFELTVNNVAPSLILDASPSANQLEALTLNISNVEDPGEDTISSITIDWGDGTSTTVNSLDDVEHVYQAAPGIYTIDVTLQDEDGTYVGVASTEAVITNVAPIIQSATLSETSIDEGQTVTLDVSWRDGDESHTIEVDWGDGNVTSEWISPETAFASLDHTYVDDVFFGTSADTFDVIVTITDQDFADSTVSEAVGSNILHPQITVNNTDPFITNFSLTGDPDDPSRLNLSAEFGDFGAEEEVGVEVDWGDGNSTVFWQNSVQPGVDLTHRYVSGPDTPVGGIYDVTLTIVDDDFGSVSTSQSLAVASSPEVTFETFSLTFDESAGVVNIPVTLSVPSSADISIPVIAGGSAVEGTDPEFDDFALLSTDVFIPSGQTEGLLTLQILDDNLDEFEQESIELTLLETAGATLGRTPIMSVGIDDNDVPTLDVSTNAIGSVWEDHGDITSTLQLSSPRTVDTLVNVFAAGAANFGSDFTISSPNLETDVDGNAVIRIPAGLSASQLQIQVLNDTANEEFIESLSFRFATSDTDVLMGEDSVSLLIRDNDPLVYVGNQNVSPDYRNVVEGQSSVVRVALSAPTNVDRVIPLTAYGYGARAAQPADFAVPSSVTIPAGATAVNVTVPIQDDNLDENFERFYIARANQIGGSARGKGVYVGINDNDTTVANVRAQNRVGEGASFNVTVSLTNPSVNDVTVRIRFSGNATSDEFVTLTNAFSITPIRFPGDFSFPRRLAGPNRGEAVVTIPAGSQSATFPIGVNKDNISEGNEKIVMSIASASGGARRGSGHTTTILSNRARGVKVKNVDKSRTIVRNGKLVFTTTESTTEVDAGALVVNTTESASAVSSGDYAILKVSDTNDSGTDINGSSLVIGSLGGHLQNATLFFDANFNARRDFLDLDEDGVFSAGDLVEPAFETVLDGSTLIDIPLEFDLNGDGFFDSSEGQWSVIGGLDTSVGQPFEQSLSAPIGFRIVSPISTVATELTRTTDLDVLSATETTLSAFGLDGFQIASSDYLFDTAAGDVLAAEAYRTDVHLVTSTRLIAALFEGSSGPDVATIGRVVYRDVAEKLNDSRINFQSTSFLHSIIQGVSFRLGTDVPEPVEAAAVEIISSLQQQISGVQGDANRAFADALASIHKTAEIELLPVIRGLATENDLAQVVDNNTDANLQNLIAATPVSNVLPPELFVSDIAVSEGANGSTIAEIQVGLLGGTDVPVSVAFGTQEGSATLEDNDFVPTAGVLTWQPGDPQIQTIQVEVNGDTEFEEDEYFDVRFYEANGLIMRHDFGRIYILNDDSFSFVAEQTPQPTNVRVVADGDQIEIYQDDALAYSGGISDSGPITISAFDNVETSFEIEILKAGPLLSNGIQFVGGGSSDDSLIVSSTLTEISQTTLTGNDSGEVIFETGTITFSDIESVFDSLSANIAVTGTLLEGQAVSLTATNPAFPVDASDSLDWTITDSSGSEIPGSGQDFVFALADDGEYTVHLALQRAGRAPLEFTSSFVVGNVEPQAIADQISVTEDDGALVLDLLGNDSDPAGALDPLEITSIGDASAPAILSFNNGVVEVDLLDRYQYLADGDSLIESFSYTIVDGDGGSDTADATIVIAGVNDAPVVSRDAQLIEANEGETAVNGGVFSDVDQSDLLTLDATLGTVVAHNDGTWTWSWDTSDGPTDSQFVTISVSDGITTTSTEFEVVVANVAPSPVLDSISSVRIEGTEVVVDASATDPAGSNDTLTFAYDVLKDGVAFASGSGIDLTTFGFTPDDNGAYEVRLTVSDEDGGSATVSENISVTNVAPSPVVDSIGTVRIEGTEVVVDASATDPAGSNDTLTFAYDVLKDGVAFASGSGIDLTTFGFTPDDNGAYEVRLTVSDEDGGSATVSENISVANVAPSPVVDSIGTVRLEGTEVVVDASATDPAGSNDTLTFAYDVLKDGVAFASGSGIDLTTFGFTPDDNGAYEVRLTVSDEDGGSATVSENISVANVAPSPVVDSIGTVRLEGTEVVVDASATDPAGSNDTLTFAYDVLKDGVAFASGSGIDLTTFGFTPDDNGAYEVRLTVSDEDGGSATVGENISITNVAPQFISLTTDSSSLTTPSTDLNIVLSGSFSDAGEVDTHEVVIDWGDGTSSTAVVDQASGTITASHDYTTGGFFEISATLTDDDGSSVVATTTAAVQGVGVVGDTLYVLGSEHRDRIELDRRWRYDGSGSRWRRENWFEVIEARGRINGQRFTADYRKEDIGSINIVTLGGDDAISVQYDVDRNVSVDSGSGNDSVRVRSGAATVFAGYGHDLISTASGDDFVDAGWGDDVVYSGAGSDVVVAAGGNNQILSGDGDDTITLGDGRDRVWSGTGNDHITISGGHNLVETWDGDDFVSLGDGNDKVKLGKGNDVAWLGNGENRADGGRGNDKIFAGAGRDRIDAGSGNDLVVGSDGDDWIYGGFGNDILIGGRGADELSGGFGSDLLVAGWTAFDDDSTALDRIMQHWTTDDTYASRVAELRDGSGAMLAGTKLLANETVFDDDSVDRVRGSWGLDWFFASAQDRLRDRQWNEFLDWI